MLNRSKRNDPTVSKLKWRHWMGWGWLCPGLVLLAMGCADAASGPGKVVAPRVLEIGRIEAPEIRESSGIVPCQYGTNWFWTHNDGHRSVLFAITREGKSVAQFPIAGTGMVDWEDIASDHSGHLYLGDLGNNERVRSMLFVHQVTEPDPRSHSGPVPVTATWQLHFPGTPFDCESLFVQGTNGYVISKVFNNAMAEIYRFPLAPTRKPVILERIATLPVDSPVTGADLSSDGKHLGLVSKKGAYVFRLKDGVPSAASAKFDFIKFRHEHIEACCFVPDGLLATAESREIYLFNFKGARPAR